LPAEKVLDAGLFGATVDFDPGVQFGQQRFGEADEQPRAAASRCPVQGCAIAHPDGVILFDTGVAGDDPLINQGYEPTVVSVIDALAQVGIDERDVTAIVNSHLHVDHCGQNRLFPSVPVYVQRSEHALIDTPRFTIPDWARVESNRLRNLDGDAELAEGVDVVATPGHAPGHQSIVVTSGDFVTVIAGQCCYSCAEFAAVDPAVADLDDESWLPSARASIEHLRSFDPGVVHLAHDPTVLRRQR
jgi:N-acyl homoserine lactone hydrolase